jgi:carboxyl-terminal processing protease
MQIRWVTLGIVGGVMLAIGQGVFGQADAGTTLAQLAKAADAAYTAKDYAKAVTLYERGIALADGADRANLEYNEACALALEGEKERAMVEITRSVEDGWADRDHLSKDTDMTSLHADPRWPALLARMDADKKAAEVRWGLKAFESAYAENLSDADKVAGLSLLWAEAKFGFANFWHVPDLDWDATYREYIPQVLATHSTAEYYKVLQKFYALLQDGHTGVYEPEAIETWPVPFETRLIEGKVLVVGTNDATFDMQGVKPGDEIERVNGEPVKVWAEREVLPYVTASSPQDREEREYFRALMRGVKGTVFHVGLRSAKGVEMKRDFAVGMRAQAAPFEFKMLPGNVAYVALNEFEDNKDAEGWDAHWGEISKARAVIVDMRKNGGGSDDVGAHVLMTLIDKPLATPRMESPEWLATYRAWGNPQPVMRYPQETLAPDATKHFAGKVVMLTGPNTFSAAEDLAVMFASSKRGVIVGEASGGSTGQPLGFKLPGGGSARVCTKHDSFPDGKEFVGVGVTPDVAAQVTREDLVRGTDSVLAAGLKAALQ